MRMRGTETYRARLLNQTGIHFLHEASINDNLKFSSFGLLLAR